MTKSHGMGERPELLRRGIMRAMDEKELRELILRSGAETRGHFDVVAERLEQRTQETKQHFDIVAERLEQKIQLVAEGVGAVGQRVDRLEGEMHREFGEVRSMIGLSYTELDRRLRTLE